MHQQSGWTATPSRLIDAPTSAIPTIFMTDAPPGITLHTRWFNTGCTSVDIGASANLEFLDTFFYLGDMLSVEVDADAAMDVRILIEWNKFGQLVPLLTDKYE